MVAIQLASKQTETNQRSTGRQNVTILKAICHLVFKSKVCCSAAFEKARARVEKVSSQSRASNLSLGFSPAILPTAAVSEYTLQTWHPSPIIARGGFESAIVPAFSAETASHAALNTLGTMSSASPGTDIEENKPDRDRVQSTDSSVTSTPIRPPITSSASSPRLNITLTSPRRRSFFQWLYNFLRFELSITRLLENQPIPCADRLDQLFGSTAYFSPIDILALWYIVITLPLFYLNKYTAPGTVLSQCLFHVGVGFAIVAFRTTECFKRRRVVLLFFDLYCPLLILFLYKEMGMYFYYLHPNSETYDSVIQRLEVTLFRCQPSQELHKWLEYKVCWCAFSFSFARYSHFSLFRSFLSHYYAHLFAFFSGCDV